MQECSHLEQITSITANSTVCDECVARGDGWLHLRLCLTCGNVGCCDSSPNRHATAHFTATGHPLIGSLEPGEDWAWCYADEVVLKLG